MPQPRKPHAQALLISREFANLPSLARGLISAILTISFWIELRRTRIALSKLTDDGLRDIGISRSNAENEAERPFYDY